MKGLQRCGQAIKKLEGMGDHPGGHWVSAAAEAGGTAIDTTYLAKREVRRINVPLALQMSLVCQTQGKPETKKTP